MSKTHFVERWGCEDAGGLWSEMTLNVSVREKVRVSPDILIHRHFSHPQKRKDTIRNRFRNVLNEFQFTLFRECCARSGCPVINL